MKTIGLVVALMVVLAPAAFAKRMAPAKVASVVYQGIEYRAPGGVAKMGVIEAWDKATGKMVWEKKVYTVKIKPKLERDVQWVFIKTLEIDAGKLVVTNEHDDRYSLDLKTQEVTKLEDKEESPARKEANKAVEATLDNAPHC